MKRAFSLILFAAGAFAQSNRVGILVFTGPQCSACDNAVNQLKLLQNQSGGSLSVVLRNVTADADEARALGVTTLPAIFVNGRRLDGTADLTSLRKTIDTSLGKLIASEPVRLNAATAPRLGPPGAPEITVFSDFQCPYCSSLAPVLTELARNGEAALRFKHFPLSFHAKAPGAHRAAWAAGEQGKFWEMHDRLFAAPAKLDEASYLEYARALGLDLERFAKDTAAEPSILKADIAEGEGAGVEGTPSLFINGRPFLGRPSLENLRAALKSLDSQPAAAPVESQPTILSGTPQSPVKLEWFFDAQSELTAASAVTVRELLKDPSVYLVARHLPMPFHPHSRITHQALVLAAQQGKFWPFLDAVLAQTVEPDADRLKSLAMRIGLDAAAFSQALDRGQAAPLVDADQRRAQSLSVRGVPAFVLNNQPLEGTPSLAAVQAAIANLNPKLALRGGPATK